MGYYRPGMDILSYLVGSTMLKDKDHNNTKQIILPFEV